MAKQWQVQIHDGGLEVVDKGIIMSCDRRINKCVSNIVQAEYIFKSKYREEKWYL